MINSSTQIVKDFTEMIESISKMEGVDSTIKVSVITKASRYLKALNGDIESANEIFGERQSPS